MALALNHKKAIIFDFDGPLVDIEPLFIEVFNALAPEFRYAPLLPDDIPEIKKLGAREFIQRRLKIPFWKIWKLERRGKGEKSPSHQKNSQKRESGYCCRHLCRR